MQFSTQTEWSYCSYTLSPKFVCTIKNNEGGKRRLDSITLRLGKMGAYSVSGWGDPVTGTNADIPLYLKGNGHSSNSVTVNAHCDKQWSSNRTKSCGNASQTVEYTFSFSNFIMNNNETISFYAVWNNNVLIMKKNAGSCSVSTPYKDTTINITGPGAGSIHKHDANMTVSWDGWSSDGTTSTTYLSINGTTSNQNSGNNPGSYTFKPSDYSVGQGTSFTVIAYRKHETNRNTASSSRSFKTYRVPKFDGNATVTLSTFSGTGNSKLKYKTNGPRWESNLETFKTYIEMQADNWAQHETGDAGPGRSDSDITVEKTFNLSRDYLERHISDSTRNTNDYVTTNIRVARKNEGSGVVVRSNAVAIRINYKPTKAVENLVFKKNNSNGAVISPGSSIIVTKGTPNYVSNVYVEWTYPFGDDTGIVDGYIVRIYDKNNRCTKTYNKVTATNKTIPVTDLNPAQLNKIKITPYYKRPNGTENEGPALSSNFVIPLNLLNKPIIIAPANNSNWINRKFRVLFKLPDDPDYSYLSSGYAYADIQLKVNNKTYTWSADKSIYSSSTLSYQRCMIVNPSLKDDYPQANTYTLQVRVKKNYGTNDEMWSEWSNVYTVSVTTDSFSVNRGELIMASHYNTLQPLCKRMKATYPLPSSTFKCKTVKAGDIIYAADYNNPYEDIKAVETAVNGFGPFDNDRNAIKFPTIPAFVPVVGEYITALSEDNNFPGRNYIRLMHDYANLLK